jgi:hypothetical protein
MGVGQDDEVDGGRLYAGGLKAGRQTARRVLRPAAASRIDQHAPVAGVHQNDIDLSTEGVGADMVRLRELLPGIQAGQIPQPNYLILQDFPIFLEAEGITEDTVDGPFTPLRRGVGFHSSFSNFFGAAGGSFAVPCGSVTMVAPGRSSSGAFRYELSENRPSKSQPM